jgi:hypothetical protein
MIITHDTTIEEYEAWLATNPSMTAFKVAVRSTFRIIYRTLSRIGRLIKGKRITRACTAGKLVARTVTPLCYDKNAGYTTANYQMWLRKVSYELRMTRLYLEALEFEDHPEDEVAMEMLKIEALEIIHNR